MEGKANYSSFISDGRPKCHNLRELSGLPVFKLAEPDQSNGLVAVFKDLNKTW